MFHNKFSISKKGSSLYFSMIILSIVLAMALGLTAILVSQTKIIKGMGDSVKALYAADTGIEEVLYKDKLCRKTGCGTDCVDPDDCDDGILGRDSDDPLPGTVGSASYKAFFNDGASSITSIGDYLNNKRAIQVTRE